MKKAICIYVAIVAVLLTACSPANVASGDSNTPTYIEHIYQIHVPEYTERYGLNDRNLISNASIETFQQNMEQKNIELFGNSKRATYVKSIYYPIGDLELHKYNVEGLDNCSVLFRDDGSVDGILGDFAKINISGQETAEELKPMVEKVIHKWLNPEDYQYVKFNQTRYNENTFGLYDFIYYNEHNGYITNFATLSIQDNGTIFSLRIMDCEIGDGFYVNKELEKTILDGKMNDLCNTASTKLEKYTIEGTPSVVKYDEELYIEYDIIYSVMIKLQSNEFNQKISYRQYILIPVELLQNTVQAIE